MIGKKRVGIKGGVIGDGLLGGSGGSRGLFQLNTYNLKAHKQHTFTIK